MSDNDILFSNKDKDDSAQVAFPGARIPHSDVSFPLAREQRDPLTCTGELLQLTADKEVFCFQADLYRERKRKDYQITNYWDSMSRPRTTSHRFYKKQPRDKV